jgi:RNA polymerase sigma-70 factor (ECF subfamily)
MDPIDAPDYPSNPGEMGFMNNTEAQATPASALRQEDLAGIRALLERRCGSAAIAEDILGDAIETSLQKLRDGAIAKPELLRGYIYRVALNHWRNFKRTDKAAQSTSEGIEEIEDARTETAASIEQARWAKLMRDVLADLSNPRDRALIVGFYLEEEAKETLCARLGLSAEHFNRVVHRARERFRALLEARGFKRGDFLSLAMAW